MLEGYREIEVRKGRNGELRMIVRGVEKGRKVVHQTSFTRKEDIPGIQADAERKFKGTPAPLGT